jgi:multidrug resistance efflux pump/transcriptional regulator with GAF, ATPase, and Fis domain
MPLRTESALELSESLLSATDSVTRASLIASAIVELIPDSACVVHRILMEDGAISFVAVGLAGPVSIADEALSAEGRLPSPLFLNSTESLLYVREEIEREDYAHLHVARSVASLAYLPLLSRGELAGVIEVLAFARTLRPADLAAMAPVARLAGPAILAAEEFERQRQNLLDSVHRMSQLYDLEKSLNATLELDEVMALAPEKALAMVPCQAMHLWLFDGETLRLMASSGDDATVTPRMLQPAGDGYVGDMAEEGEPLLITDAEDERLLRRNAVLGDDPATPPITTALLVPLMQDEAEIGVIEAVNKSGGEAFDEDDQFFLSSMAETVSSALKNSSLMHAERKLAILEALVHVSSEITSTLRLDRLLQIIVNSPQNVLPYERCAIALDHRGSLQLKAVSGMASIPLGDAQVDELKMLVRWLEGQRDTLHLRLPEEAASDAALPEAVARYFESTGNLALYSLPLTDDQGRVGLLLYASSNADFLDLPHTEMIKILAGQATVAIRNALLYREVPLISLLEPLVHRKQVLLRTSGSRRLAYAAIAAAVLLFLVLCPLPMRVGGDAVVAPLHLVTIAAPLDGTVASISAHEGQRVAAGDLLGTMNDWQWRTELDSSEAKYRSAELVMEASLARGSAEAGADRAQAEILHAELARARSRLEDAQLRSPVAGIVATPALQNAAGEHLNAGDTFAQVIDLSSAVVDVAVAQGDVALVRAGQSTAVKLDSYPQRSWHGSVDVVSPLPQSGDGERTFAARVPLPNGDAILRAGMTGRAKIFIGFRPAGYVLLRRPALWLWQTLWNWIGW